MRACISRLAPFFPLLCSTAVLARVGGGEHYTGPSSDSHDSGGGSGSGGAIVELLIYLLIRQPAIGVPLLIVVGIMFLVAKRRGATSQTQRAFQQREAERRTEVTSADVSGWVATLRATDPAFELPPLLEQVKQIFIKVQHAWLERQLAPVRPFLSDATFQRLSVQLRLLELQGVRDALAELAVLDAQLIGFGRSGSFDTLHVRLTAQVRDTDVPATMSTEQASAAAARAPLERFTEVWSLVRRPGATTRVGHELFQGKCPQCGAPFKGGATNNCEFCGAVVNAGTHDWVLAEITQGSEHVGPASPVLGLEALRQSDPGLSVEVLEDRASLLFWRWIDALSTGQATALIKLATPELKRQVESELRQRQKPRVFLECAVGAVRVISFQREGAFDQAHVELRWSARERPAAPAIPQRSIFTLVRKAGAQTPVDTGMSTDRCPQCHAPPGTSDSTHCDYCGTELASGERDWVLARVSSYEGWRSRAPAERGAMVTDREERERLLYLMAAVAKADGQLDGRETKLLKLCAERWSVPYANIELALNAAPAMVERLLEKGSPEAEALLQGLIQMALVDGRVDRAERRLLESIAAHLGMAERLPRMLSSS